MLEKQKGVCAICFLPPLEIRLAVDHCHKTGKIRGLLCTACNNALGCMLDSVYLLGSAIAYLQENQ